MGGATTHEICNSFLPRLVTEVSNPCQFDCVGIIGTVRNPLFLRVHYLINPHDHVLMNTFTSTISQMQKLGLGEI